MEIPRLGVESELQLPAYTTATEMWDPSHVCDLHHSSRQYQILNPLSKAGAQTRVLMGTGWVYYCWAMTRTPKILHFYMAPNSRQNTFFQVKWFRLTQPKRWDFGRLNSPPHPHNLHWIYIVELLHSPDEGSGVLTVKLLSVFVCIWMRN